MIKNRAPNYIPFGQHGKIGYENLVYITSEILYSYGMTKVLPDFITLQPWSTVKKSSTVFIPMAGISTATDTVQSYIEIQHKLPSNVFINNHKLNMAQMLKLEARSLMNLNGNLYQSVILGSYTNPASFKESSTGGDITKKQYSDAATATNKYISDNGAAPAYTIIKRDTVRFSSLVYLFANIINSAVHNNRLPEMVPFISWAKVSDKKNIFLTMDSINTAAETVKNNVETQHTLPYTVKIGGLDVNMADFLYLEVKSVINLGHGYYGSIILSHFKPAHNPNENLKLPGRRSADNYMNVARNIRDHMNKHGKAVNHEDISPGTMRFENLVFMYSQILAFSNANNNQLPQTVGIHPWSTVTDRNQITFSPSQIVSAATKVKSDIESRHNLPDHVVIGEHQVSLPAYLKLLATTVSILGGTTVSQLTLKDYKLWKGKSSPSPQNGATMDMTKYLSYADKVEWSIYDDKKVGRVILGVRYQNWIYVFSQILNSYKSKNTMPNVVMITPWRVVIDKNTKFFTVDHMATAAALVQSYIETKHALPNRVSIWGTRVNMATFLRLMTTAVLNIHGNLNTSIISLTYSLDKKKEKETIHAGSMNKTAYLNATTFIKKFFDNNENGKLAPRYSSHTPLGKAMLVDNLVYTYTQILNSYKLNNNTLPEHITVNPWSVISNSKTKFVTVNQIITTATTVTVHVEHENDIPKNIIVGNISMNPATYLRLLTSAVLDIHGNLNTTVPIKKYDAPPLKTESLHKGIMDSEEYINLADSIEKNYDAFGHVIDIVTTSNGKMGFKNVIYVYSQLLNSYSKTNNTLPNLVAVTPWDIISDDDTIFYTIAQIQIAAQTVKSHVETKHMLPESVRMGDKSVEMPSFLSLLSHAVRNVENYFYASVIYEEVDDPNHPSESITTPGTLDSDDLSDIATAVISAIDSTKDAPNNIANTNLGTIGYYTLISTFSNVMASYNSTKPANDSVIVFPSVTWFNPDGTFNFRTGKIYNREFLFT